MMSLTNCWSCQFSVSRHQWEQLFSGTGRLIRFEEDLRDVSHDADYTVVHLLPSLSTETTIQRLPCRSQPQQVSGIGTASTRSLILVVEILL